ncbi:ComEA family DNA-binding protein [Amycolatopsis acidicola]|uniref:ComEA family DNA-binding protein n=1 Tax=Amycolatopsis acidicola TaxID=2596893 RepID=A0A5N0UY62_9PSEU|nr:ComEA family DNA-binding protein [Amycolatopsis acidicola]KAA9158591.1 ComEA family DNA-binding protein [Amycolatopsis acidicola]
MFEQTIPEVPARTRLEQLAGQALAGQREPPSAGRLVERWVPAALARSPLRRRVTAIVAALVAVVVLVVGSVLVLGGSPPVERAPVLPAARDKPAAVAGAPSKVADSSLVVSVVGKVRKPGLVSVPGGARVADALSAAGGPLDGTDVTSLNLARKLTDGEQLYVGIPAPPPVAAQASGPVGSGDPAAPAGKLDLNTASAEQLDALPGVGAVTAKRIIDWRTQHGSFAAVDQLQEVDGIGATRFAKLRDEVTVS